MSFFSLRLQNASRLKFAKGAIQRIILNVNHDIYYSPMVQITLSLWKKFIAGHLTVFVNFVRVATKLNVDTFYELSNLVISSSPLVD